MKRICLLSVLFFISIVCQAGLNTNLLLCPGFEDDFSLWTTDYGDLRSSDPSPHGGGYYLIGSYNSSVDNSYTYQTIDLLGNGISAGTIDSGLLDVHYGGWQAGWSTQQDSGKIEIVFSDGSNDLGSNDLGWFYSSHTWVLLEAVIDIPVGTRFITYGFYAKRYDGYNTDGYLDDAFLEIVPEPTTLCLLGLGGLLLRRRKGD